MKTYTVKIDDEGNTRYLNEQCELHREDGPAMEFTKGDKAWYKHGHLHREDGPAIELIDGRKCWYQNGVLHRTDGPAYEGENHYNQWWINGNEYFEKQFLAKMKLPIIDCGGNKFYYNEKGQLHREDGPAIEWEDGNKAWCLYNERYTEKQFNMIMNNPKEVEMTMAEINKMAGCKVKIVESH